MLLRWSWVTTDSTGEDIVNEDQHWRRIVDVLTVYLEDGSVAVEQDLIMMKITISSGHSGLLGQCNGTPSIKIMS